jgi:hypothetical protein
VHGVYLILTKGGSMGSLGGDERRGHGFSGDVDSLGVPMSPMPHVSRHRTEHIRGLISTERTRPQRTHAPAFLCTGSSRTHALAFLGIGSSSSHTVISLGLAVILFKLVEVVRRR